MKTSRKLWVVVIVGLVVVVVGLAGVKATQIVTMVRAAEKMTPPPMAVSSATAELAEWAPTRGAIATLVAVRGVTLAAELPGRVTRDLVRVGQLRAAGAPSSSSSTPPPSRRSSQSAQAEASLAKLTLERARTLRREESTSQAELDAAEARAQRSGRDGRLAPGHHRQEDHPRPVRRPYLDPPGRARAGGRAGDSHRLAPVGDPHLRGLLAAAAGARRAPGRASGRSCAPTPSPTRGGTARSRPSTRRWTRPPATCGCAPPSRTTTAASAPACSRTWRSLVGAAAPVLEVPATAVIFAPYGDSVFALAREGRREGREGHRRPAEVRAARGAARRLRGGGLRALAGRADRGQRRRSSCATAWRWR